MAKQEVHSQYGTLPMPLIRFIVKMMMGGIPSLLQIVKTMMALKIIEIVNHFNNILITFKMKKIVITLICLLFFCEATYAQIKTEKYFIGITNTFFMGVSSNMSPMESYLSQRDELHKNPSLGVLGFSYEGDAFLIDNLHITWNCLLTSDANWQR